MSPRRTKAPKAVVHGWTPLALLTLLACTSLALLLAPQAASAAQEHAFSTAFGSPGAGAGQLALQPFKRHPEPVIPGSGLAVNDESGDVYVADSKNHRVDEFTSAGAFLRAFGWEVNASSPEAKLQSCTSLTGCQIGSAGTAPGQLGNPTFLAVDNSCALHQPPLTELTTPKCSEFDPSSGDLYVASGVGVEGQDESQELEIKNATGGTFTLEFEGETTVSIPYNASRAELSLALERLPTIGFGNVFVNVISSGNPRKVRITFRRALEDTNVPQLVANSSGLQGAGAEAMVSTFGDGVPFSPEIITKYGVDGELIEGWGALGQLAGTPTLATGTGTLTEGSAIGTGTLTNGSSTVSGLSVESGTFKVGQGVEAEGSLPANDYITAVGSGKLTLAKPAVGSGAMILTTNNRIVTNLNTASGAFEAGQTISGAGIPAGTEINQVGTGYLALTRPAVAAGSVSLTAKRPLTGLSGIAVDRSGGLLVAENGPHILRFDQAGAFGGRFQMGSGGQSENLSAQPAGLAVDAADHVYFPESGVRTFDPTGKLLGVVAPSNPYPVSLALQPFTGDLYLDLEGASIEDISHQCEPVPLSEGGSTCPPAQTFGSSYLSEAAGLALAPDGTLYAANTATGQVVVFKVSLEANVEAAAEVKSQSAVLNGTVDPRAGGSVTLCRFQHGETKSYGENLPCLNEAGEEVGTEAHPLTGATKVHAPLEGLQGGTTYHYRLRARNTASEEIHSEDEEVETLALPRIQEAEAAEVTASTATLEAKINPLGPAVIACEIEWGPTGEPSNPAVPYQHTVACEPPSLPAGNEAKPVSLHIEGLSAETTYHWRIKAHNHCNPKEPAEECTATSPDHTFVYLPGPPSAEVSQACPNESLREQNGSTALPDCRAYEQVTPVDKNGGYFFPSVIPPSLPYAVSEDGSRFLAPSLQCSGGAQSCNAVRGSVETNYLFSRVASGWSASPLAPSAQQFEGVAPLLDSVETGKVLFGLPLSEPSSLEAREWLYGRSSDGSLEEIGPVAEAPGFNAANIRAGNSGAVVASADLSHVVYQESGLWPSFDQTNPKSPNPGSLYEYAGPAAHPFLVPVTGEKGSTDLIGTCGASLGGELTSSRPLALSAGGRTVYFSVHPCATGSGANEEKAVPTETLYARIDGEREEAGGEKGARTVKISAPAPEPACDSACRAQPPRRAEFAGASTDGSMAYFLSTGQLTNEASEGEERACKEASDSGCNLYLYRDPQEEPEPKGDHLIDVSAGDSSAQGPQVQGVMAISQDGQKVYFVAKGLLTGKNAEGAEPLEGAANLYYYDAAEGKTRFIAALPGSDEKFEDEFEQWREIGKANVTPDGRYLLFTSHAGLTPDATRREGPAQVYRYDAQAERLTRVSIGQRGFADNGNAGKVNAAIVAPGDGIFVSAGRPPFNPSISADGKRVFFESPVALTPGALNEAPINNHEGLAQNVYEWEEDGTGSCEEAGGCLYLISDGRDTSEGGAANSSNPSGVHLIGVDQSGEDVFFTTADPLVPADGDTQFDIYDAHVGGGFPPPPHAVPCESSEACHPGQSEEGSNPTPPHFEGPEEGPGHPYCAKGLVLRHGSCVKKHPKPHKRKHRHRKHRRGK